MKRYYICNLEDIPPQPLDTDDEATRDAKHNARVALGAYHCFNLDSVSGPSKLVVMLPYEESIPPTSWEPLPDLTNPDGRLSGQHVQHLQVVGAKPGHMTYHAMKALSVFHPCFKP